MLGPDWSAGRSKLVKVFVWEGDVDAAWKEAVVGTRCACGWSSPTSARRNTRRRALAVYQEHVERLIGQKNNPAYAEAVEWMRKVNGMMARLHRAQDFPSCVASVRAAHKPKRNLMKLLDRASW